jgi:hypothetical protein
MYAYRLRVFHAVATYRSYSRAAREALHISQPAVSRHVQALEEQLGVQLFHRVGKQIALTEAGAMVLACVEQMHILIAVCACAPFVSYVHAARSVPCAVHGTPYGRFSFRGVWQLEAHYSSSSALASCRSAEAKPSVKQP